MTEYTLRIGSRKSELALEQTYIIERLLKETYPNLKTEIITSDTLGDKNLISPLQAFGTGRSPFEWSDRPGRSQRKRYACKAGSGTVYCSSIPS